MKKIIKSSDPVVMAASGVDQHAIAQANLSEEKNIKDLLGGSNEAQNNLGRNCGEYPSSKCGN